jgi:hypothetical protein
MRLKTTLLATLLALTGWACHSEAPPAVDSQMAKNLQMVAEGRNMDLVFKADAPGRIIVNNFTNGGNLYTGHLNAGDVFTLSPNSDHAMIGKKQPARLEYDTNMVDTYRLYFLKD